MSTLEILFVLLLKFVYFCAILLLCWTVIVILFFVYIFILSLYDKGDMNGK